jgi:8-oxo-dGTP pyrophosphatase MutT (NUDIX family)
MPRSKQVAALPWRRGKAGVEILLVTTRTTKRWVIPKGWPMTGIADYDAAAIEAFEEAGVRGITSRSPLGRYGYLKLSDKGKSRQIEVTVYALQVKQELNDWPEREQRERCWVKADKAASLTGEPELVPLLKNFADNPPSQGLWQWISNKLRQSS